MHAEAFWCRKVHFSANRFFGEFDDDKKFASFSPEFLALTRMAAGAPDASVGHDDMSSVAPGFLKNQAFAGANAAGIRDELQS
jgi:hypothetical protein